jgi:hypothetical protein
MALGSADKVRGQSASGLGMDVREALRLMRLAGAYLDMADADRACSIYDRVLDRFPTWWIALTGRVRCGIVRNEHPDALRPLVERAERFGGPVHVIAKISKALRVAQTDPKQARRLFVVELETDKTTEVEGGAAGDSSSKKPPGVVKKEVPPTPLKGDVAKSFLDAWIRGDLRAVVNMVRAAGPLEDVSTAAIRIVVEAGFLLNDGAVLDYYVPELLVRTRNRPVLVRYLRSLKKRGKSKGYRTWFNIWEKWTAGLSK